jgi:ATP-dependent DNA ligase
LPARSSPRGNRIRYRRNDACVFLYAFDLIELNGDDLRRDPLVVRKATLASVLAKAAVGIRINERCGERRKRIGDVEDNSGGQASF